jgi:carbon monoxide dehydrogenase subunit G
MPIIPIVILGVVVAFIALVASRPSTFRLERSARIAAPPAAVFALINDLHQWGKWSPWEKLDPEMKKTYGGPAAGPGATYAWLGNKKAGEGQMTILESVADQRVTLKLEFKKPMAATNDTVFTLTPAGDGTQVSWVMTGVNGFGGKLFQLVVNIDKLVGKDFEAGLANLDRAARG